MRASCRWCRLTDRRDMAARHAVHSNELLRRAYKYIARNTTLPPRVRHMAQLELNTFPNRSRPATVKERCTETGRGRGILTDFGLCRVCVVADRSTSSAKRRWPATFRALKRRRGSVSPRSIVTKCVYLCVSAGGAQCRERRGARMGRGHGHSTGWMRIMDTSIVYILCQRFFVGAVRHPAQDVLNAAYLHPLVVRAIVFPAVVYISLLPSPPLSVNSPNFGILHSSLSLLVGYVFLHRST